MNSIIGQGVSPSYQARYIDCLQYIEAYWDKVTVITPEDDPSKGWIGLPHPYLAPNTGRFPYQFYWDSKFIIDGILGTKYQHMVPGIVANFAYMFDKLGIMPNFSNLAGINRSQPPLFADMVLDEYQITQDKQLLKKHIEVAKQEYKRVWNYPETSLKEESIGGYHHKVPGQLLSRYGDRDAGYAHTAELESGWDFTNRYGGHCNEYFPIDLNAFLFKYEIDFIHAAEILGDHEEAKVWMEKARQRKEEINRLMWNEEKGYFFDYRYATGKQSNFVSLAGFTPLWAGLATHEQASRMMEMLAQLETPYGVMISTHESAVIEADLSGIPEHFRSAVGDMMKQKQWDYPNIWQPLEYLTVLGLLRYGFIKEAKRIMEKSVQAHAALFRKYGTFQEKMNGETGEKTGSYHYSNQEGFSWTNAVFYRYVQMLDALADLTPNTEIHTAPGMYLLNS